MATYRARYQDTESTVCEQQTVKCHNCAELRQEMGTVKTTLAEMSEKLDSNFKAIHDKFDSMEEQPGKIPSSKVVVAGGWDSDSYQLNSVELFDPSKGTWTYLQPMKEYRESASAFVYKSQIIVSGGCIKVNDRPLRTDSMETLQNANQVTPLSTWKNFPEKLPGKLTNFSTVVYNDSLIVVGGYDQAAESNSGSVSEVSLVHPYAIKMLTKMPRNIMWHAVELFDDKVVIVGGRTTQGSISNVLLYDIKKNKCEELAPLPYPVHNMATVRWADNVIVIGGMDSDEEPINTVIIYNIKTQQSYSLLPMIHKRASCTAVVVDNTIIVMGGQDEEYNLLKSVERFSFMSYTWEELPSMHEERRDSTSVAC